MKGELENMLEEILEVPYSEIDRNVPFPDFAVWDSLKHVQLVVGIQGLYGIDLEREEIQMMQTVNDIRVVLEQRGIDA